MIFPRDDKKSFPISNWNQRKLLFSAAALQLHNNELAAKEKLFLLSTEKSLPAFLLGPFGATTRFFHAPLALASSITARLILVIGFLRLSFSFPSPRDAERRKKNCCSRSTNFKLPFFFTTTQILGSQMGIIIFFSSLPYFLIGTPDRMYFRRRLIDQVAHLTTFADTSDTSRIIRSNSAFPSASFWFKSAIFSENFRGFAIFFSFGLFSHTEFSTENFFHTRNSQLFTIENTLIYLVFTLR